jgi:hypothetical protein
MPNVGFVGLVARSHPSRHSQSYELASESSRSHRPAAKRGPRFGRYRIPTPRSEQIALPWSLASDIRSKVLLALLWILFTYRFPGAALSVFTE